jgi:alkanesulfonate monooxygenase SsuD/methylene tetrahydromethanopterin reductase-like flavin-dependent oxidoreductase (luciferase family)
VKLGITLPSFREDPGPALEVAVAAERAGLDGVFAYDHLFRRAADGSRRPALELLAMMGAVAAETSRVVVGSLVARATLRPPATLAAGLDTVARIAGADRVVAGIGTGDAASREEMETFGLPFGTADERVEALRGAVDVCRDRGFAVWVGGNHPAVRATAAAHADGWNHWGGGADELRVEARSLRAAATRTPFTVSWGGLLVIASSNGRARTKAARLGAGPGVITGGPELVAEQLRAYADAGADWVIAGPVDSSDPDNAHVLGELVRPNL